MLKVLILKTVFIRIKKQEPSLIKFNKKYE
jgi:hypothetical protein